LNLPNLLRTVIREYNFHVYHTLPITNGYLFETNVGTKYISVWRDKELLNWSFLWREEVAKKGFRTIDRFIRSRDGAPFVQLNKEYIVVQDQFQEKRAVDNPFVRWETVGRLTGLILKTCQELLPKVNFSQKDGALSRAIGKNKFEFESRDEIFDIKKELYAHNSMFSKLVQIQWKEIEKRWKHATTIQQVSKSSATTNQLFPAISLAQWGLLTEGCLGFSCQHQEISLGLRDVAGCMKDLYVGKGQSINVIDQFCSEFEKVYQPSLEEHYSILANFIYPQSFLAIINKFLQHNFSSEECIELWMKECEVQEKVDRLRLWQAERIDRLREESVLL
jgi:hypothetical protein